MRRSIRIATILAAGALLVAWSQAALADGYVTGGTQWWYQSKEEAKYQEFREVPQGLFIESFLYRNPLRGGYVRAWGANLLRSDEYIAGDYHRPRWTAEVSYRETPHNLSFVSSTGYAFFEPGIQGLPDALQAAVQLGSDPSDVTILTDYLNHARPLDLGLRTDALGARLKGRPGQGFRFEIDGSRRNRSGYKAYGGSFGFGNVVETAEPIRQSMAQGEARLSYTKKKLTVEGLFGVSAFDNHVSTLTFDNPNRLVDSVSASSRGRIDLYPDNRQWRAGFNLNLQLPHRSSLDGAVEFARSTQNDPWLPYTINSALFARTDSFPLPGTSTDAKADLRTVNVRLTSHPFSRLGTTLRFRDTKYDNKTKSYELAGQAPYDGSWAAGPVETTPFGNEQLVSGADVDWSPIRQVGIYGTAEFTHREHTYREILADNERAGEGKIVLRPKTWLTAMGRYRYGDRDADELAADAYLSETGALEEQPGLRRFDVASRIQNLGEASLSWTGVSSVALSLNYRYMRNEYHDTPLGLQDDLQRSGALDLTFAPNDRIDLMGSIGYAWIYTNQASRTSNVSTPVTADTLNWRARLYDEILSATGDIGWHAVPKKVDVDLTYFYERSPGTYRLTSTKLTPPAQDLPGTSYMRQGVGTQVTYALTKVADVSARWSWEQYDVNDFASEGIPLLLVTGTSRALFLGDNAQDYVAQAVALVLTRRF
jgi:MtrB/PioB family decaheme-associated outer membrane protein